MLQIIIIIIIVIIIPMSVIPLGMVRDSKELQYLSAYQPNNNINNIYSDDNDNEDNYNEESTYISNTRIECHMAWIFCT